VTRHVTTMTLDDAEHYTAAKRAEIIASYPEHERDARAKGIPTFGSGLVFPVTDESITVEPFPIPKHWLRINGLDFGYDHPFGATSNAWDTEADVGTSSPLTPSGSGRRSLTRLASSLGAIGFRARGLTTGYSTTRARGKSLRRNTATKVSKCSPNTRRTRKAATV
jgi:hypothetical protein